MAAASDARARRAEGAPRRARRRVQPRRAKATRPRYPRYEGGFFVTVFADDAHERALRMKEKGVFVVPAKGALRVALCSVAEKDVPRLVDALASA